jgi:hypothetical protein
MVADGYGAMSKPQWAELRGHRAPHLERQHRNGAQGYLVIARLFALRSQYILGNNFAVVFL